MELKTRWGPNMSFNERFPRLSERFCSWDWMIGNENDLEQHQIENLRNKFFRYQDVEELCLSKSVVREAIEKNIDVVLKNPNRSVTDTLPLRLLRQELLKELGLDEQEGKSDN